MVVISSGIITRRNLFKKKGDFHKELAKLPFEEKIKILVKLQKIANEIRSVTKKTSK